MSLLTGLKFVILLAGLLLLILYVRMKLDQR